MRGQHPQYIYAIDQDSLPWGRVHLEIAVGCQCDGGSDALIVLEKEMRRVHRRQKQEDEERLHRARAGTSLLVCLARRGAEHNTEQKLGIIPARAGTLWDRL